MTRTGLMTLVSLLALAGSPSGLAAQQSASDGQRLFQTRCASCHSIDAGRNRIGPNLAGVVGREAGSLEGARYSRSLPASGIVWDDQSLDSYLANPRQAVPGTTMTVGVPDANQRAAIIAYLSSLSGAN